MINPKESQGPWDAGQAAYSKASLNPKANSLTSADIRKAVANLKSAKASNPSQQLKMAEMLDFLMMKSLFDMPETADPGEVKREFERFMAACQLLIKRDPDWEVKPDVDDPLVRFALRHKPTGTIVKLNYPFNEVIVQGKAAFINRTIDEKVPWPKWYAFCEGKSEGL